MIKKIKEQNRINNKFNLKKREDNISNDGLPKYLYIVCEGEKTEPNYLHSLCNEINRKFYKYSQKTRIIIKGAGKNTRSLLDFARISVKEEMPYAQEVWLVYDKDDFPKDDFDNTQYSAEGKNDSIKYKVAWSNECFELWLILHFQYFDSPVDRNAYIKQLKTFIPNYKKNIKDIYEKLKDKIPKAIRNAKKLYKNYAKGTPPSKMCPATRVYELVEYLQKYS